MCLGDYDVTFMKDEWVISRVFQKNLAGNVVSKKTRIMSSSSTMSLYPAEPNSPSSVYLPPLLDSSPAYSAAAAASSTAVNDLDSCSNAYDSKPTREHVSCFSTISGTPININNTNNNFNNFGFDFPVAASTHLTVDPFSRFHRNGAVSAFPSLRSLQDNLQLPLFFPPAPTQQPPFHGVPVDINGWAAPPPVDENRVADVAPLGAADLDCMWGF